jgi:hypothetical protein
MIALLSAEYQQSEYCRAEYNHVLAKDPANLEERLIVLRVATCDPVGSLQNLAYTDLVPVMSDRSALTRRRSGSIGSAEAIVVRRRCGSKRSPMRPSRTSPGIRT